MTTSSMVQPNFLSKPEELGVVAVGFSGGQVSPAFPSLTIFHTASQRLTAKSHAVQTGCRCCTLSPHFLRTPRPTPRRPRLQTTPRRNSPLLLGVGTFL